MLKKLEKIIRTNKNQSPFSLSLDPGHNTDGLTSPHLAQGDCQFKATKMGSPSKETNSQPFQMSSFSCLQVI